MIKEAGYKKGRVTLTWYNQQEDMSTGLVRCHVDPEQIPGDYDGVVTIIVSAGEYEELGFLAPNNRPSISEFRDYRSYLKSLGLKRKKHDRAKNKEVPCPDSE